MDRHFSFLFSFFVFVDLWSTHLFTCDWILSTQRNISTNLRQGNRKQIQRRERGNRWNETKPIDFEGVCFQQTTDVDEKKDTDKNLKRLCKMKMTVMPIVVGAIGVVSKNLEKRLIELEIGGRTAAIQTTAIEKSAVILSRVLKTEETCSYSDSRSEKPSVRAKNLANI